MLRHVSAAFVEDPVRILRVARFAARFPAFRVAPETLALMREMVENGEVDALVPERVWQELAKGLMETAPSRMFLASARVRRAGPTPARSRTPVRRAAAAGASPGNRHRRTHHAGGRLCPPRQNYPLPVRFAALTHDLGKGTTPADILPRHIGHEERSVNLVKALCKRMQVPNDCRDLALIVARFHGKVRRVEEMRPDTVMRLLQDTDAMRQPERFEAFLLACECDSRGRTGFEARPYPQADNLRRALRAAQSVDAGKIAAGHFTPDGIRDAVYEARLEAVKLSIG